MKRCTKCILPETIPGIKFDNKGVCNYCNSYEHSFSNWESIKDYKEEELTNIASKAKSLNRPYDCLIPLSGGKDSTYALYIAKKKYGLNCLAITFDNGFLSNQAKINIDNATKITNTDHIIYCLDKASSYELFNIFLKKTGGFCDSCMRGINYSIEMAVKQFHIPLIIKGSGRRVQYVSQIGSGSSNSAVFFKKVIKGEKHENKFLHMGSGGKTYEAYKFYEMLFKALHVPPTMMMRFIPLFIGMYDYIYKSYDEIIPILEREMGWSKKDENIEHLDCEFHNIPFYIKTLIFENTTTNTLYHSGLIRQGIMTREDAMKMEMELMNAEPPKELNQLLEKLNITHQEFLNFVLASDNKKYIPKWEALLNSMFKTYILKDK